MGRFSYCRGPGFEGGAGMELGQHEKVQEYLNAVCFQIKCREVHGQIRLELLGHMEERVEELKLANVPEEEAVNKAIGQMGDAFSLGKQLHQAHKPRIEWSLLALIGSFVGIGLLTLLSIERYGLFREKSLSLFPNSLVWLSLGLIVAVGINCLDYRKIRRFSMYLYAGTLLVWLFVLQFGPVYNGKRFLNLFLVQIDFIGITPFLLIVALAGIFSRWNWDQRGWFVKAFILYVVPCLFFSHGSMYFWGNILYTAAFLILILFAGAGILRAFSVLVAPISVFLLNIFQEPYMMARILAFINAYKDPQGAGYIYVQSIEAIRSAGFWGQGFTFPANNIPLFHTELIFTYIVYTFGWIAGLIIFSLAVATVIRMTGVAMQVKEQYGRLLVIGLTGIFAVQFFWNILMTLGFAPISGFNLPFISYGGSQLIIQLAAMGLILSVYRRKDMVAIYK